MRRKRPQCRKPSAKRAPPTCFFYVHPDLPARQINGADPAAAIQSAWYPPFLANDEARAQNPRS